MPDVTRNLRTDEQLHIEYAFLLYSLFSTQVLYGMGDIIFPYTFTTGLQIQQFSQHVLIFPSSMI